MPTIWNGLLRARHPHRLLDACVHITAGGAAVPQSLIEAFEERFGVTIIQGWGMTETSPLAALAIPPARRHESHDDMYYKVKAGRVVAGRARCASSPRTARVLPNDGKSIGEFEIRGPWITGSYYKDEDPGKFHDGWLRTGDVGCLDGQGYMTISDRTKDVIKSGGEWISSVELENAVMAHPDVFEAAVIAIPDPKWSERPLVAVVPNPGRSPAPSDLRRLLGQPGATLVAARPVDIHRPRCPRPASGKFDKKVMRAAYADGDYEVQSTRTAQVSGPREAMERMAERLEGCSRSWATWRSTRSAAPPAGDPDSQETGEALAEERRILKARRALGTLRRRAARGLRRPARAARRRRLISERPHAPLRGCVARRRDAATPVRPRGGARPQQGPSLRRRRPRWHVTLRFLGEVHEDAVGPLGDALMATAAAYQGPVECRLGPGNGWFTGVRRAVSARGRSRRASPAPCAPRRRPLVPEPTSPEPEFNGHLTLARSKGRRLSVAALGEMAGIPFEVVLSGARRRPGVVAAVARGSRLHDRGTGTPRWRLGRLVPLRFTSVNNGAFSVPGSPCGSLLFQIVVQDDGSMLPFILYRGDRAARSGTHALVLTVERRFVKITIIGTGSIGSPLGRALSSAGHQVTYGSRHANEDMKDGTAADVVPVARALVDPDVVILALPGAAVADLTAEHAGSLRGRLVIDATNQMGADVANARALLPESIRYARAFNTLGGENMADPVFGDGPADMFFSAPADDRSTIESVIEGVGLRPIYVGEDQELLIDALFQLWIALAMKQGRGRRLALRLLEG